VRMAGVEGSESGLGEGRSGWCQQNEGLRTTLIVNGDGLGQIHRENEQRHVRGDNCGVRGGEKEGWAGRAYGGKRYGSGREPMGG
jgi:hypothetical protein